MSAADKSSARKPVIGLVGGIGAGKSAAAAEFARLGCIVIDSDAINREIIRRPEVLATMVGWWGCDIVATDGGPDRSAIAAIVFGDDAERQKLEGLTHPLILAQRQDIIRSVELDSAVPAIILDSPLLFEARLDRECDAVVFIDASEPKRLERLRQSRNWSLAELRRREQAQMPLSEKRGRADFVLANDGTEADLRDGVQRILASVLAKNATTR